MKNMIVVDTTLVVLGLAVILHLFAAMAGHNSLGLLSAAPREFQYLAGIIF